MHIFVFTNDLNEINEYIREKKLEENVRINKYVDYFSFLNLCKDFDVLLVVDAITIDKMPINPYLPSKYSDYRGSGSSIWAVIEDNSPLSFEKNIQYFSKMNDVDSIMDTYNNIYHDFTRE